MRAATWGRSAAEYPSRQLDLEEFDDMPGSPGPSGSRAAARRSFALSSSAGLTRSPRSPSATPPARDHSASGLPDAPRFPSFSPAEPAGRFMPCGSPRGGSTPRNTWRDDMHNSPRRSFEAQQDTAESLRLEEGVLVESRDLYGVWWRIRITGSNGDGTFRATVYDSASTEWQYVHPANCAPIGTQLPRPHPAPTDSPSRWARARQGVAPRPPTVRCP